VALSPVFFDRIRVTKDEKIGKNKPIYGKSSQICCQTIKCQNKYIESQNKSSLSHLETLTYLQQAMLCNCCLRDTIKKH
jgi:hypothetical protein